jgi:hypothetical protein
METNFEHIYCNAKIVNKKTNNDILIIGKLKEIVKDNKIYYIAASPPDYRATYTGSGLPFANQSQAFDNTPNKGVYELENNIFKINIMYPNSYYVGLGTVLISPTLYIEYINIEGKKRNIEIKISDGIPYRMLTYPMNNTLPRKDPMFYKYTWLLPVRTQEQILRDSAYPETNKMADNFWGLKPSV